MTALDLPSSQRTDNASEYIPLYYYTSISVSASTMKKYPPKTNTAALPVFSTACGERCQVKGSWNLVCERLFDF